MSMLSDFYSKFIELPPDGNVSLRFSSPGYGIPVFEDSSLASSSNDSGAINDSLSFKRWIPSENFYSFNHNANLESDSVSVNSHFTPISIADNPFCCKSPKWTSRSVLGRTILNRMIDQNFRLESDKATCRSRRKLYSFLDPMQEIKSVPCIDALILNNIDASPLNDDPYLGNCMCFVESDNSHKFSLAYCDSRLSSIVRQVDLEFGQDSEHFLPQQIGECKDVDLNEEILQLEAYQKHIADAEAQHILCRTASSVQLISPAKNALKNYVLIKERYRTLKVNPYIASEAVLCSEDCHLELRHGQDGCLERITWKTKIDNHFTGKFLVEWSDHVRCFLASDSKNVVLYDVRIRPRSDEQSLKAKGTRAFWTAPNDNESVHILQRFPVDSHYFLVATNLSAFILDQRQPFRAVYDFKHGLTDVPVYGCVSESWTDASMTHHHRAVVLANRRMNECIWAPVVWSEQARVVCGGAPPRYLTTPAEYARRYFRWRRQRTRLDPDVCTRLHAPIRGMQQLRSPDGACAVLTLSDVGDVACARLTFGRSTVTTHEPSSAADGLHKSLPAYQTFIERCSGIYVNRPFEVRPAILRNSNSDSQIDISHGNDDSAGEPWSECMFEPANDAIEKISRAFVEKSQSHADNDNIFVRLWDNT